VQLARNRHTEDGDDRLKEQKLQRTRARGLERVNPALMLVDAEDVVRAAGLFGEPLSTLVQNDITTAEEQETALVSTLPSEQAQERRDKRLREADLSSVEERAGQRE